MVETVRDAQVVLDTGEASPRLIVDAIAIAYGAGCIELVAELTERLVRMVDPIDRTRWQFREAVYTGASALLADSTLGTLSSAIDDVKARINDWYASNDSSSVSEASTVDFDLSRLALLLSDGNVASLTSAASRLRKFDRPDLAQEVATAALEARPKDHVTLTTRAAASLDRADTDWAERDLAEAWPLSTTFHTPSTLSRLETMKENYPQAIEWADVASARDENGNAGLWAKAKASRLGGYTTLYSETMDELELSAPGDRHRSEMWTDVLLASELRRMGHYTEALQLLAPLIKNGYPPARRLHLQILGEQHRHAA